MNYQDIEKRYKNGARIHKEALEKRARAGQNPDSFWIACMDSGNSPNTLLGFVPGDIFVIRTPGGFVPPYNQKSQIADMLQTAFVVAVKSGTTSYNILPHTLCGAAKAIAGSIPAEGSYLAEAMEARRRAIEIADTADPDKLAAQIERQFAITSLFNIRSYPALKEKLHAGHFTAQSFLHDINKQSLLRVNPETNKLEEIEIP